MNFSDLNRCPFCGNDDYYTHQQIKGNCQYKERFDGEEADNSSMHDNLVYSGGNKAYCSRCEKYLGNRTKDTVSIEVEKLFKRISEWNKWEEVEALKIRFPEFFEGGF